jgi:drug/metabolite transporter (DMT)-like permease
MQLQKSLWARMTLSMGEIAALITAMCYSASSIFFTMAGRKFGPLVTNRLRLVAAVLLLGTAHWIVFGLPIPSNAEAERWFWLGSSGIVGLVIGDLFLFQAYITLGPRLGLLFLSLSPALTTLLAWIFLGETLSTGNIFGIVLTLAGIAWVVMESSPTGKPRLDMNPGINQKLFIKGIFAGMIAAAGQSFGMVLAKKGLTGNFPALSANVIRMSVAFLALWVVTIIQGQVISTVQHATNQRVGLIYVLGGSFFGPLIGVSLSLFAIQNINLAIASTIIALPPIFLLPIGHFVFKERITWRAVVGTVIAVTGVALLFLI